MHRSANKYLSELVWVQEAAAAFVKYLYEDELDGRMDAQSTVALLHVAHFFGAPHLVCCCTTQSGLVPSWINRLRLLC